jgi:RND family efflux transporter MFP subunit
LNGTNYSAGGNKMSTITNQNAIPHRRPGILFGIIAIVLLAVVGTWAYFNTRPVPATVQTRDIIGMVPLDGEVITPPSARAEVMAPFRAPVDKVVASVGARVHRGEALVQLSFPSGQAAVDQAKQAVQIAEAAYANARRQFDGPVLAARQQLERTQLIERSARNSETPPSQPPEGGISTPNQSPVSVEQAASDRAAAEQSFSQAQMDRDAMVIPFKMRLDSARDALQQARSGSKLALVRAPITGTLMALNAQPGQEVGSDNKTPVATIVDLDALQVQARIAPDILNLAKPRAPIQITFNEIANKVFEGKVDHVTSQVVSQLGGIRKEQQYVALIQFSNDEGLIKPGMKPHVGLKTGEVKNALAVPNDAIGKDDTGRPIVKVLRGGSWQPVVVQAGISDGSYTQITMGLKVGETIQVTPSLIRTASLGGR